jgi:hypothetical protein
MRPNQQFDQANRLAMTEEQREHILHALYRRIRQQETLQNQHQQQQQQNPQQQDTQFEKDFDVTTNVASTTSTLINQNGQQQVSTPINNSNIQVNYFDRENSFRKSNNLGENIQKPTPDDKMRYFYQKQAR